MGTREKKRQLEWRDRPWDLHPAQPTLADAPALGTGHRRKQTASDLFPQLLCLQWGWALPLDPVLHGWSRNKPSEPSLRVKCSCYVWTPWTQSCLCRLVAL